MRHRYRVSQSKNPFVSAIWDKMSILQDVSFLLAIIINLLILLGYGTLLDPQTPLPLNSRCVRCEDQYCAGYTLTNRRAFSVTALTSWWIPLWWPTLHLGVTEPMSRYGVYPPPPPHTQTCFFHFFTPPQSAGRHSNSNRFVDPILVLRELWENRRIGRVRVLCLYCRANHIRCDDPLAGIDS